jgi:hypothetical protein
LFFDLVSTDLSFKEASAMDCARVEKLVEAIQFELGRMSPVVVVDRDHWDPADSCCMYVSLKPSSDSDTVLDIADTISLEKALADGGDKAVTVPLASVGTDNFLAILAEQVDVALVEAEVGLTVDVDELLVELGGLSSLEGFDSCVICPYVKIGTNDEGDLEARLSMRELFSDDALGRIKGSIEWSVSEGGVEASEEAAD